MKWFNLVMIAMLVWGNLAFASIPNSSATAASDAKTISSWTAHLNYYYPDLKVAPAADVQDPAQSAQVLQDLQSLEGFMGGSQALPPGSLKSIACARPQCDGGGDGRCHSCNVGN